MKYTVWLLCYLMYGTAAATQVHSTAVPEADLLELPAGWSLTPLMAPTESMGLRVSSYMINESEQSVIGWRDQYMAGCRLPAASEDDDWHCFNERYIYSLLWRAEGFIWVVSERVQGVSIPGLPGAKSADLDAVVLSHNETPVESVTLLHSRRTLYGLQRDLLHLYSTRGARLLLQEQNSHGFIQQWQHLKHRVTYTAQKDELGDVFLVRVEGTNL